MTEVLLNVWERAKARFAQAAPVHTPTPLEIFDWAVVRQSDLGPGVTVCAHAFKITPEQVRSIVAQWDDTRGVLECVRDRGFWKIDAYYVTAG